MPSPQMPPLAAPADALTDFVTAVVAGEVPVEAAQIWHSVGLLLDSYRQWNSGERATAQTFAQAVDGDFGAHLRAWYEHLTGRTTAAVPTGSDR